MIILPAAFKPYENQIYKRPGWLSRNWMAIAISLAGLLVINLFLTTHAFRGDQINAEKADHFGSFVGGYFGSQFALLSVVLLYLTLRDQRRTGNIEKFEGKYFELLRLHRQNVTELGDGGDSGRKLFVYVMRELRSAHRFVIAAALDTNMSQDNRTAMAFAYLVIYYGIGPNSSRQLEGALSPFCTKAFIAKLIQYLKNEQDMEILAKKNYISFSGQQSRLGHYYRHLYQTIRYVDGKRDISVNKYEYVKTIRAQLTNHEQALLLINSLTPLGGNWWADQLIIRYKLVKNLPLDFFDPKIELDPTKFFPPDYFEWQK